MLHSRKLRYIDEIARTGSIRKAAERLNVASSAISRQILALEEEFGVPLFERLPRGLRLTAAGEVCIEHIREVLKSYDRMERRIRGLRMTQTGTVTLTTTVGLAAGPLPEIVQKFATRHPRVHVRVLSDAGTLTINPVISGEADLGLGFNIQPTPGLKAVAGFDVPIGVVLPPGHRLAEGATVDPAEMLRERLVICLTGNSLREAINLILEPLAVPLEPMLETNSIELMKQMVIAGDHVSMLNPLDVWRECEKGELVFRPIAAPFARHQQMKIFSRSRSALDATASLFMEFLLAEMSRLVIELQDSGRVIRPA